MPNYKSTSFSPIKEVISSTIISRLSFLKENRFKICRRLGVVLNRVSGDGKTQYL
jgi:hypothetical protein